MLQSFIGTSKMIHYPTSTIHPTAFPRRQCLVGKHWSARVMLRTFLNVPIMFSNWFRCFSMFNTQQLTSSYNRTLCFLLSVVYSLPGQYWSLSMGISFHSVDIPKAAILSQVFNQMEHMVLFRPVWEKGHSVDSTMLRGGACCDVINSVNSH